MPFFKKLVGGAQNVFKKATGNLDIGLRKIGNTAGKIGSYVDKATPYLTAVNPELGMMASQVSGGLQQGRGLISDARAINQSVRSGDISGAIQKAKAVSQQQAPSINFA
jgi:hypothetical protein